MKKYFGIGILALVAALSLGCFAACSETGTAGGTGGTGDTNYQPGKNSHLLKEGETTCEHCGEQLYEGSLKFTLSDNQKYYTVSGFGDASGDVVVPDFYCSRGDDTYLPVLELSGNTGDKVEALEIPAVAEECKIYSGNGLKEVRVAAGNSQYAVKNGVLYDDTLTELLLYPVAKEGSIFSVPANVKKIGNNAFGNSSGLTGVDFASDAALISIGDSAFFNCESLQTVEIPAGVETLGDRAFYESGVTSVEFVQGSVLKTIGDSAFAICDNLQTVEIPASVETLGESAFLLSGVTSVEFAQGSVLKTIGKETFFRCENLRSVAIPAEVTEIGIRAFTDCSSLQSVAIPAGVTEIGQGAFQSCTSLTTVEFAADSALKTIGDFAFSDCKSLQTVVIPASVETLGENAFGNSGVTAVEFAADSVLKTIGDTAFMFCNSIEQIIIPASVENMGDRVFDGCGWYGQQRICVPFAADNLPAGWSAGWAQGILSGNVIIEYNYTGN